MIEPTATTQRLIDRLKDMSKSERDALERKLRQRVSRQGLPPKVVLPKKH